MGKIYKDNENGDTKACEMTSKCYCINKRRQRMDSAIHCPTTLTAELSVSVVECLTRDRRAAGSRLTGVTALWSLSKTYLS